MGTTKVEQQSTAQATPTAEETELNRLKLEQQRAIQGPQLAVQQSAFDLSQKQLTGQPLPGALAPLGQGLTAPTLQGQPDIPVGAGTLGLQGLQQPDIPLEAGLSGFEVPRQGDIPLEAGAIGEEATSSIVQNAIRDLLPQLQKSGVPLQSGVTQSVAARTAGDIRRNVAESNIERQLGIRQANQARRFQETGLAAQLGESDVNRRLAIEESNRARRQQEFGVGADLATADIERQLAIQETNQARQFQEQQFNVQGQQATQFQNLNTLLNLLNLAVGGQAQIQRPVIAEGQALGQRLAGLRTQTGTQTQSRNPFQEAFFSSLGSTLGSPQFSAGGGSSLVGFGG